MTRTMTRRETNRLRTEIKEGIEEYLEERDRAAKTARCGTVTMDVPDHWLRSLVLTASPGANYLSEFRFVHEAQQPQTQFLH